MQDAEKLPSSSMNLTDASATRDPLLGTVLLKRYEVIEQIGTGRFSVVYKARQLLMNRLVAIKSLKRDLLDEKEVVARFKKEARALSRLRHPNIVAVFDCFESQNGRPYLVMDYLDGMSLEDLLGKDKGLTAEMAKPIFLQVCDALAHAHKQGVLHRDLKPGNMVLLAETKGNELVQLVDFGLAQVEEEVQKLTQDGECCGSPAYMSPEHCTGEPLDGRSDMYSFGVVMYEVLTGVVPFKGRTSVETMRLQVYESPPTLNTVRPDLNIPQDVEQTVMRCLEKDPEKRYQTAAQLKEAITNWGKMVRPPRSLPRALTAGAPTDAAPDEKPQAADPPKVAPARITKARDPLTANDPAPNANKLKRWTDTQQKASALRIPIIAACFVGAMMLAIVATHILSKQGETGSTTPVAPGDNAQVESNSTFPNGPGTTGGPLIEHAPTAISVPSTSTPSTVPVIPHVVKPVPPKPVEAVVPEQTDVAPAHVTPKQPEPATAVVKPAPRIEQTNEPPDEPVRPVRPVVHQPSVPVTASAPEAPRVKRVPHKPRKHAIPRQAQTASTPVATPEPSAPPPTGHRRAYQTY